MEAVMACDPSVFAEVPIFSLLDADERAILADHVELRRFVSRQRMRLRVRAPWHDARGKALDVRADVAGAGEPDAVAVADDVLERAAELPDAVRAAHDERM